MAGQERPRDHQREVVSRWLVLLAVAWTVLAGVSWLDEDASAAARWSWTALALLALAGAVFGIRTTRAQRGRRR